MSDTEIGIMKKILKELKSLKLCCME